MSAESSPTLSVDCDRPPELRSLDLTNRLPDAIIQHILSFLPTKQAVATSVLSKRWRYLWTLVPNLEFDNSKADVHDGRFSDFVNNTLRFHRVAALDKFHLKCSPYGDFSEIESWLDVAILRRPRELKLSLCSSEGTPFRLPGSVLNCRTIAVLKLKGEGILVDVGDSSVQLPCLKVLHLFFVHYLNDESLTGLLSGCLALEEIHFRRSYYRDNVKNLCINVPSLRRLVLVCPKSCVVTRRYKLEIKAPALRYLELRAVQCQTLLVEEFPELVGATLDFCGPLTGQLFSALRNVEHLSLDNLPISLPQGGLKLFPIYPHLVHLEFTLLDSLWGVLMNLLENSPNLKALIICKDERNLHWSYPEYFPNCVTNQLETFCIRGFTCSAGEMSFMRYILEEAEVLRRVSVHVFHMDSNAKLSLHEQFSAFPKSSNSCQIEII